MKVKLTNSSTRIPTWLTSILFFNDKVAQILFNAIQDKIISTQDDCVYFSFSLPEWIKSILLGSTLAYRGIISPDKIIDILYPDKMKNKKYPNNSNKVQISRKRSLRTTQFRDTFLK